MVQTIIEESGLPRTLLAQDSGLSRYTLLAWMGDDEARNPTQESLEKLADGLEKRAHILQLLAQKVRGEQAAEED